MKDYQGIYTVPLLGKALRWVDRVLGIGRIETQLTAQTVQLKQDLSNMTRDHGARLDKLDATLERLHEDMRSYQAELSNNLTSLRNEWKATLATQSRALERSAASLSRAYPELPPLDGAQRLGTAENYVKFEDAFRGRWKVEERVRWYMPQVREVYTNTGSRKPCLDIGCGRGEFLLELKRNGFPAVGCDLNPAMADAARAQGLEVVLADAVAHLNSLDPASVAVISAFHLVEHLAFEHILDLLTAASRALIPGGLLILETPNPENLAVGACTFWYDPTHIRPLPPALLKFYAETAGFAPVRTARFYLRHDGPDHATVDEPVLPSVDGPLDYGLLATKPR